MSDAEKLAEEILRVLESQLDALDMLRSRDFEELDRADKIRPGLKHALELAREVVAKGKEGPPPDERTFHGRRALSLEEFSRLAWPYPPEPDSTAEGGA